MFKMNRMGWSGIGSIAALAMAGAVACSSNSSSETPAPAVPVEDAGVAVIDAAPSAPDAGTNGEVTLQVLNFLSWCSVTINGGAASSAPSVTASVAKGSTATIAVTPASSAFTIGPDPWLGVTQNGGAAAPGTDKGSGATETSTATVVVGTGNQCVSVCCELPNNGPPACPTTNPCGGTASGSSSGGSSSGATSSGSSSGATSSGGTSSGATSSGGVGPGPY
jgi:hypothetical protein